MNQKQETNENLCQDNKQITNTRGPHIIKDIINDLLKYTIQEIKQKENMTKIQAQILDPIITYAFSHLYPYIIITSLLFFFTFVIAVAILIFILRQK